LKHDANFLQGRENTPQVTRESISAQ